MDKLYIIKIGGQIIDDEEKLSLFLKDFALLPHKKILVHGGGKLATRLAEQLHLPQQMIEGRRITDADTLKVVTMVYAGWINKTIVAQLQANNCNAVGLSGADGNIITAKKREAINIDYGFAGDISAIDTGKLHQLLMNADALVLAPITHNGEGQLLNTNADTIAQEVAKAMAAVFEVELIYSFEKAGVLLNALDESTVIPKITPAYYAELKEKSLVFAGMIPKLDNAFGAVQAGVQRVVIGNALNIQQLAEGKSGTSIIAS
jgi:acetylglutamate kinase